MLKLLNENDVNIPFLCKKISQYIFSKESNILSIIKDKIKIAEYIENIKDNTYINDYKKLSTSDKEKCITNIQLNLEKLLNGKELKENSYYIYYNDMLYECNILKVNKNKIGIKLIDILDHIPLYLNEHIESKAKNFEIYIEGKNKYLKLIKSKIWSE